MEKFIQLTALLIKNIPTEDEMESQTPIYLNVDHISMIRPSNDQGRCLLYVDSVCAYETGTNRPVATQIKVAESYDQVKGMLK